MGKSTINGHFPVRKLFVYQRVAVRWWSYDIMVLWLSGSVTRTKRSQYHYGDPSSSNPTRLSLAEVRGTLAAHMGLSLPLRVDEIVQKLESATSEMDQFVRSSCKWTKGSLQNSCILNLVDVTICQSLNERFAHTQVCYNELSKLDDQLTVTLKIRIWPSIRVRCEILPAGSSHGPCKWWKKPSK